MKIKKENLKDYILTNPFNYDLTYLTIHKDYYYIKNILNPKEAIIQVHTAIKSDKTFTNIEKQKRSYSIVPHPSIVQDMIQFKSAKKYIKYNLSINVLKSISKLLSSAHSVHELTGDLALSNTYLKKSLSSFVSYRDFYNLYLNQTRRGNSFDGSGCSSYEFLNNPYDNSNQVYSKVQKVDTILKKVLNGTISLAKYQEFYDIASKQKPLKPIDMVIMRLSDDVTTSKSKNIPREVPKENYKDIIKFKLPNNYLEILDELDNDIGYMRYPAQRRRYINSMKLIRKNIVDEHIYFNRTFTSSGRIFDILNQIPKKIRNGLFRDYIEFDLENAAPRLIKNCFENHNIDPINYPCLIEYIKNRKKIIESNVDTIDNIRGKQGANKKIEFRSMFKMEYLSAIFGRHLTPFNRNTKDDKTVHDALKLSTFYKDFNSEMKELDIIARNLGYENISRMFMLEETKIMNSLKAYLGTKKIKIEHIVNVHDGLLIPINEISKLELTDIKEIQKMLKLNNQIIDFSETRSYIKYFESEKKRKEFIKRRKRAKLIHSIKKGIKIGVKRFKNNIRKMLFIKLITNTIYSLQLLKGFMTLDRFIYTKVALL